MDPVVHFEMPYEDKQRAADFYSKAFGWQSQMMGPEMGDYIVMTTAEVDQKTMVPREPGRINGGFFRKSDDSKSPLVVVSVEDIQAAMKRVTDAGGKILQGQSNGQPVTIPGVGLYIGFVDSEGNRVALLQPMGM